MRAIRFLAVLAISLAAASSSAFAGECNNSRDDDGDGLIDISDPGCDSSEDPSEINPGPNECYQYQEGGNLFVSGYRTGYYHSYDLHSFVRCMEPYASYHIRDGLPTGAPSSEQYTITPFEAVPDKRFLTEAKVGAHHTLDAVDTDGDGLVDGRAAYGTNFWFSPASGGLRITFRATLKPSYACVAITDVSPGSSVLVRGVSPSGEIIPGAPSVIMGDTRLTQTTGEDRVFCLNHNTDIGSIIISATTPAGGIDHGIDFDEIVFGRIGRCGDGIVDKPLDEWCDDGDSNGKDGFCNAQCSDYQEPKPNVAIRSRSGDLIKLGSEARAEWLSWQRPTDNIDVDSDGSISPLDAQVLINELSQRGVSRLPRSPTETLPPPFLDVNGNGWLTAADLKEVVNANNSGGRIKNAVRPSVLTWRVLLKRGAVEQEVARSNNTRFISYRPLVETLSDPSANYIVELEIKDWSGQKGIARSDFEVSAQCSDGIDNDLDGVIDQNDPACLSESGEWLKGKNSEVGECQDGLDNDGDTLIDFPADPGCKDLIDNDETDLERPLLTVGIECLVKNIDGTRTAYFSYNNLTDSEIKLSSDSALKTVNEFIGTSLSGVPPVLFKKGLAKASIAATFSGDSFTWVVKAPGSLQSQASASDITPLCPDLKPVAECQGYSGGILKVKLGYNNSGSFERVVPVGKLNGFSAGVLDRGQPNRFFPGLNSAVFQVALSNPKEKLVWNINNSQVVIDESLKICGGQCVSLPVGTVKGNLDKVAADLAILANKAADILASTEDGIQRNKSRDRRDAKRAKDKALRYEATAKAITIEFPDVIKNCPEAPAYCQTVDRFGSIEALKGLYANQRNSIVRIMSRTYFRATGSTKRDDKIVKEAKALEQSGLSELSKLPRFATECK